MSAGLDAYKLSYQVSPIILTGGIAKGVPGGGIPIINFTQPGAYEQAILSTAASLDLDSFFASYSPMSGGTLIDNQVATFPFANQAVAANAIITQPLRISLMMICPARGPGGYQNKTQIMQALQKTIAQHNNLAGTYSIATPAFTYRDCIMTGLRDVSSGPTQVQSAWQWDFVQPLLTLDAAQVAMNNQMQKIAASLPIPGDPPRVTGVGTVTPSIGTSIVPSSRPLVGAGL